MWRILAIVAVAVAEPLTVGQQWSVYKLTHGKAYSVKEDTMRFSLWEANRKMVENHNAEAAEGLHEWTMALQPSSDWTQEEFEERMMGYKAPEGDLKEPINFEDVVGAPSHLDFRESGQVTGVKNQGQCGSCWAFSSTGCLEGMWKKGHGQLISMSEQQMVDCAPGSCQGGWMYEAWNAVRSGIESEQTYPYTARDGRCHANSNNFVATNSGYQKVGHSESALQNALYSIGYPISVVVHVGSSFQHYNGGVFSDPQCQYGAGNHAVLAVGWDKSSGSGYWIVKNSWGGSWGSSGYIKMKIGENSCGLANNPMYATP
jgi:cathepsin L